MLAAEVSREKEAKVAMIEAEGIYMIIDGLDRRETAGSRRWNQPSLILSRRAAGCGVMIIGSQLARCGGVAS
jgi:hypothetical protein